MTIIIRENLDKIEAAVRAMHSFTVIEGIRTTIDRELAKFGVESDRYYTIDLNYDRTKVYVHVSSALPNGYDLIMSNPNSTISDTKNINCIYTIKQVLVDYGIECDINFHFICPLPVEDINTLRMLGKVKWTTPWPSSPSEQVVCTRY